MLARDILSLLEATPGYLNKPESTSSVLLSKALTSMGHVDAWRRQRGAVVAAIGGGISVQSGRHEHSVASATALGLKLLAGPQPTLKTGVEILWDIVQWASRVASRGIVSALLGPISASEEEEVASSPPDGTIEGHSPQDLSRPSIKDRLEMENLIVSYLRASRAPRDERDQQLCQRLANFLSISTNRQAERCYRFKKEHEGESSEVPSDSSLMMRLAMSREITESERAGNSNSILLAGVETTYSLIACTFLHLSQSPLIQQAIRQSDKPGKLISSVLKETLRINPPVMGLPRIIGVPEGISLVRLTSDEKFTVKMGRVEVGKREGVSYFLPQGTLFAVDLISAAHGMPRKPSDGTASSRRPSFGCCLFPPGQEAGGLEKSLSEEDSSSTFNATLDADDSKGEDLSCPFGLGARSCPAGSLSLLIAQKVVQCIAKRYSWTLTNPEIDKNWIKRTKRVPTLIIDGPIALSFTEIEAS